MNPPSHPIIYTYIYKVCISFPGVGGMNFSYTIYIGMKFSYRGT